MPDPAGRRLLHEEGQVYVTLAAARAYWEARYSRVLLKVGEEEARRELTERLLDAHWIEGESEQPELWRARSRPGDYDISARVVREGRLLVVVAASWRRY